MNMQQWIYYCGEPDAITAEGGDGEDAIMLYFYEREDIQQTWVLYITFKNNLLTEFGLNNAKVNDHSGFTILNDEHMPK
ncbi:MAG: hypothetical protein MUF86_06125 [Akkermansiaceae bacterium]|nr:hypothetical protein [Akkermansiaceae bacterium]